MTRTVLTNAQLATLSGPDYGLVADGALAIEDGRIAWVGPMSELPADHVETVHRDMNGRLITPGLIDCHTHLIFGGTRAREFEQRLQGVSYEQIARLGGGILSTVEATRAASLDELVEQALPRLDALIAEGVTTLEVKSGYGLDRDTELKMLRAARRLADLRNVHIVTSFLGAHACPPDFKGRSDAYIDEVCIPALHAAHAEGLVDAVDGFCEGIAFDTIQIARVFDAALALGLPVKLHAEQLSHQGGTALAARYNALSADHVEYATEADARAMAKAGSVATLLPGAFYTLHETKVPPVAAFRAHGVPMALSTDCNPGSSPMSSLLLAMNMGCTLFRLTPEEALRGVTQHAAGALGLTDRGVIAPGQRADLAIWNVGHPAELSWHIGFNPLHDTVTQLQTC
ncbi:MAG: imidazolonepropionase [Spiribacter salinus]|uniref:Imidazolonepropionase n=1 Tax=Spiribacter salinus TaxID=1335746 RepID=A0A540VR67_9GAMM|nr:MAG: imidazolonepropionase [Spiribacter salinus]